MENDELTIWCSLTGTWPEGDRKLGEQYVRILQDMVYRNLFAGPGGKKHPFKCLTDAPIEGVDCVVDPDMPKSWWNKLWLFKYAKTGRNFYFDLDTAITGRLEPVMEALRGNSFVNMQDLAPRDLVTTGLFYWEGDHSDIYDAWVANGPEGQQRFIDTADKWKDRNGIGDGAWFAHMRPNAPYLQSLLPPKTIVSYKWEEIYNDWPSADTSIVCFHGLPRPHHVTHGWAPRVWCMGGIGRPQWIQIVNTKDEKILDNIYTNIEDSNATLVTKIETNLKERPLLVCGGGPSLGDAPCLANIRLWKSMGAEVWALNGAYNFLREHGIIPDGLVIMDARPQNISFLSQPHGSTTYYLSTMCDPSLFEKMREYKVVSWTPLVDGVEDKNHAILIGGGSTVGTRALCLALGLGYRKFQLYGFDSSYRNVDDKAEGHAFAQPLNNGELDIRVVINGKEFHCARWMARQCDELRNLVRTLVEDNDCELQVFGDGLFPYAISLDVNGGDEPEETQSEVAESSKEGL